MRLSCTYCDLPRNLCYPITCRKNLATTKKQAVDAAETIRLLRQEASNLKKSVKELVSEKTRPTSSRYGTVCSDWCLMQVL